MEDGKINKGKEENIIPYTAEELKANYLREQEKDAVRMKLNYESLIKHREELKLKLGSTVVFDDSFPEKVEIQIFDIKDLKIFGITSDDVAVAENEQRDRCRLRAYSGEKMNPEEYALKIYLIKYLKQDFRYDNDI